ncbi:uncharacterized protein LOC107838250 [Poecilia formosa]|uniref:uncharacterized protein LOC107838250 n=1 Tax=Poecilia formosa TaxID=48698 RepID=UPI0007B7D929|nr:PREDICTED: uncharacterized protein LOC107838250 [Poecilia formosa]
MTLLWVTVFLLHQGYALVPVVTVQLGEPVTFTCDVMNKFQSTTWLQWYKQSAGGTLKLITMQRKNVDPTFGPEFPASRFSTTNDGITSNLTILGTVQQDEGMYYCALIDWTESIWKGTHLIVKGNSKRTLTYTTLDSETLQCSVVLEYWDSSCSGDLSVFWLKSGSSKSYPNIIYTEGRRDDNCEKSPNAQRKCNFLFPGNISSSDLENYYCAVATCGEILFGNEIRKEEVLNVGRLNMT